jgi:copper chaperone CopZ
MKASNLVKTLLGTLVLLTFSVTPSWACCDDDSPKNKDATQCSQHESHDRAVSSTTPGAVNWEVTKMKCKACVKKVTKSLQSNGAANVSIDLKTQKVSFDCAQDSCKLETAKGDLEKLGYTVR